MNIFKWNAKKNEFLARKRGITFEEIVQRIGLGSINSEIIGNWGESHLSI
jgi:hypothetical protein